MEKAIIAGLILLILGLVYLVVKLVIRVRYFNAEYKDIIDIDRVLKEKQAEVGELVGKIVDLNADFERQNDQLSSDYKSKRTIYEELLKEISLLEEDLETISYGLYKPHFTYNTSEEFRQTLEQVWNKQKDMIRVGKATYCPVEWQVGGSRREGERMIKHNSKLMLRAFNGECDSAIAKVSWNNIGNMESRIQKAHETINKLGATNKITITHEYFRLKLDELRLEFELQEKMYQEKEEQKRIKAQMREEELAQREIERAQKEAEDEERRYQKALEKAKADVLNATGQKLDELNSKIQELEENLKQAQAQKERAMSRAQLTKSGHVYIISNIGSFGDNVYKIGMTRRLEPMDRVHELGDASVPFSFDVHAMVYSENAPELENIFHKRLDENRLNLVNHRREFFNVTLEEIEKITTDLKLEIQLTKIAEAKEYRESRSIKEAKFQVISKVVSPELQKFPASI